MLGTGISLAQWVSFGASCGQSCWTSEGKIVEQDINTPETIETCTPNVICDGGGTLGHPRIFLSIGKSNEVECPNIDYTLV